MAVWRCGQLLNLSPHSCVDIPVRLPVRDRHHNLRPLRRGHRLERTKLASNVLEAEWRMIGNLKNPPLERLILLMQKTGNTHDVRRVPHPCRTPSHIPTLTL